MTELLQHPIALLGLKSLLLIAIAFGLTRIMTAANASASNRSLVWTSTIIALVLLPLCSLIGPSWSLEILPPTNLQSRNLESIGMRPPSSQEASAESHSITSLPEAMTASAPNHSTTLAAVSSLTPMPGSKPATPIELPWIPLLWGAGALVVLSRTFFGWISLRRLKRQARQCFDEDWLDTIQEIKTRLGIRRSITLLMSRQREIPMTWGTLHPSLHLPLTARSWSRTKREDVITHELAHISRYDSAFQLLGQIVTAVYWFNPLIWRTIKELRSEQEAACDDTVLRHGQAAHLYAGNLTAIITGHAVANRDCNLTLAAGRPGQLETRIEHILSASLCRRQTHRHAVAAAMGLTLFGAMILGSFSPFTSRAQAEPASAQLGTVDTPSDLESLQKTLLEHSFRAVDAKVMKQQAIDAMIQALNDPHAKHLTLAELREMQVQVDLELYGIGAHLRMEENRLQVVKPIPGSPALEAGLLSGDQIIAVDDTPTKGQSLAECVKLIRGPLGSNVSLSVSRNGDKRIIEVVRGRIKLPSVYGLRGVSMENGIREPHKLGSKNEIGYFQISYFGKHTASEIQSKMTQLADERIKGVIIDLRYCPGGSLKPATEVANLFLDSGDIVTVTNREGQSETTKATNEISWELPLVIIVNEATASAGEIVSGALQDHGRAIILGTRSFGKGSVQTLLHLGNSLGAIRLTTAKYTSPQGRAIDRVPGARSWGVEADEGFFVAGKDPENRLKNRLQGVFKDGAKPILVSTLSPTSCRNQLDDLQLAAALETIESRIATGSFTRVGGSRASLHDYIAQQELQAQRQTLLEKLDDIQSAVGELLEVQR